ncbi:hypothetical protein GCM10027360_27010 [Amycolatopsis echigonensis]
MGPRWLVGRRSEGETVTVRLEWAGAGRGRRVGTAVSGRREKGGRFAEWWREQWWWRGWAGRAWR